MRAVLENFNYSQKTLDASRLITPVFLTAGNNIKKEISSIKGQYVYSPDTAIEFLKSLYKNGLRSFLLFEITEKKDAGASFASSPDSLIPKMTKIIKKELPAALVVSDLSLNFYTTDGHCGIISKSEIDEERTNQELKKMLLMHAQSGVDIIMISVMIDSLVANTRKWLDQAGFSKVLIMAQSAKMASALFAPLRSAKDSGGSLSDKKSYQLNPANFNEAVREIENDIHEGADIIVIKPAMFNLDLLRYVKENFEVPVAAFETSGEFALNNCLEELSPEGLPSGLNLLINAGADFVISYLFSPF